MMIGIGVLGAFHGVGSGSAFISSVECEGTEEGITNCTFDDSPAIDDCSDVAVLCRGNGISISLLVELAIIIYRPTVSWSAK